MGRVLEGTRTHLIETARLLNFSVEVIEKMTSASEEECETMFLQQIVKTNGGAVDWRAKPREILDVIDRFLSPQERLLLTALQLDNSLRPAVTVNEFDNRLINELSTIRALDSFGDSIIVLRIPRSSADAFDEINKYWII